MTAVGGLFQVCFYPDYTLNWRLVRELEKSPASVPEARQALGLPAR